MAEADSLDRKIATVVALDLGGQGPAVALYNHLGDRLYYQQRDCSPESHDNGRRVEYDCVAYINACVSLLKGLQDDYHYLSEKLVVGIAGQGSSFICWDKDSGKALTPIISWQDTRAWELLLQLNHSEDPEHSIENITGLKVSPHFGASKFSWCLDNLPDVRNCHNRGQLAFGPLSSYLLYILTQGTQHLCDPGTAQRTLLWNIHHNEWSHTLCQQFRIPISTLPQLRQNYDHYGSLQFGHIGGQPLLVTAMHRDQNCCLYADGENNKDTLYINIGTGAFAQRIAPHSQAPSGLLTSPALLMADHNPYYAWEGTVNGAAAALPWLEKQLHQAIKPEDVERALSANHKDWRGFFINAVSGLGAPYWRTDIEPEFFDAEYEQQKLTAWIESIIFQLVQIAVLMQQESALVHCEISGGMAASDELCQRLSDLLTIDVLRRCDGEASLRGIAFLAAHKPSSWQARVIETRFSPRANASLQQRYLLWQQAMQNKTGLTIPANLHDE